MLSAEHHRGALKPVKPRRGNARALTGLLLALVLPFTGWHAAADDSLLNSSLALLDAEFSAGKDAAERPLKTLSEQYRNALTRRMIDAQEAGDLPGVLAAREAAGELDRGVFPPETVIKDPKVRELRRLYTEKRAPLLRQVQANLAPARRQYLQGLEALVASLTKAGAIEDASRVEALKEAALKDVPKTNASGFSLTKPPDGFSLIPGGSFTMGDAMQDNKGRELPLRQVTVSSFYMSQHETTKKQWDKVREWAVKHGYTDLAAGAGEGEDHPVYKVSWFDALKWCNARSEKEKLDPCYTVEGKVMKSGQANPAVKWNAGGYRLPTEAEWEKAARGGLDGKRFPFGDTIDHTLANFSTQGQSGGSHPKYDKTAPVGTFPPNGFGLYDVAGNVWEWCWDWHGPYSEVKETVDPRGVSTGSYRVGRGGCWASSPHYCGVATRENDGAGNHGGFGFRVARSVTP